MSDEEIIFSINKNIQWGVEDLKAKYDTFFYYSIYNVVEDDNFTKICLENIYGNIYFIIHQYDGTVCLATFINTYVREQMLRLLNERTIKVKEFLYSDIAKLYLSNNTKHHNEKLYISINNFLSNTNDITKKFFIRRYYCLQSLLQIQRDMRIYLYKAKLIDKKIQFKLKSNSKNIVCAVGKMDIRYLDEFNRQIEFDYIKQRDEDYYNFGNSSNEVFNFRIKQGLIGLLLLILLRIIALFIK